MKVNKKKFVLKNKKRFLVFLACIGIIFMSALSVVNAYSYKEITPVNVVVREGDTLWEIAEKYGDGGDIRKYIYEIKKLNNMKDSEIIAGMVLQVPVK